MKKLAIVIDSFSGMYLNELKKNKNIFFLSLIVEIPNYEIINEGIEIPNNDIIKIIKSIPNLKTSLPSLSLIQDLIKKLNTEYEHTIFLPVASHISGTHDTLLAFTKNYKNMTVINTNFISDTYFDIALKAISMMENDGKNIDDIIFYIKNISKKTYGFIIPDDLSFMINSGRLKGIKKHIISSKNLSPIVKIYEKLSIAGISRNKNLAVKKVFEKLNKFCTENYLINGFVYKIVYSYGENNLKIAEKYADDNKIKFKSKRKSSISVLIHTGYGAIYIGVTPKI